MNIQASLAFAGFRQAIFGLAAVSEMPLREIMRAEAASALKGCANDTKVIEPDAAELRARVRLVRELGYSKAGSPGDVSINAGLRGPKGRLWLRSSTPRRGTGRPFRLAGQLDDSGTPSWENYHHTAGQWGNLTDAVADYGFKIRGALKAAVGAVGLTCQSWVQIADAIGKPLETVPGGRIAASKLARARAAIASNGQVYQNGRAREYQENRRFVLELANAYPNGVRADLDRILIKNIAGRARYYERNMSHGVFNSLSAAAKKYPGIAVRALS